MISDSLQIQIALNYLAALNNNPNTIINGNKLEQEIYDQDSQNYTFIDHANYTSKTPEQKMIWWRDPNRINKLIWTQGKINEVKSLINKANLLLDPGGKAKGFLIALEQLKNDGKDIIAPYIPDNPFPKLMTFVGIGIVAYFVIKARK